MPFEFKLPDISQNQLLMAGLSTLGSSMSGGNSNPFAAAMGGFQAGSQMDKANKEEAREQAAYEEQQRQKQAWEAIFNPGGGQQGPQYAQAGGGGDMANVARTPGIAPPIPGQGMPGSIQAMMSNPQTAGLLQSMGPQVGGKFLLEQMMKKPSERKIIKGADGYNYYADTQERVIPGIEARDPDLLSPEAQAQRIAQRQAGKSETNIDISGDKKFSEAGAKAVVGLLEEGYGSSQDAMRLMESNDQARELLESGMITGTGAEWRLQAAQMLQEAGIDMGQGDAIANTQAYFANRAAATASLVKSFGSGAGITDADREFANRAAAGEVNMTEESLRRILDMGDKTSRYALEQYNQTVDRAHKAYPDQMNFWQPFDVPEGSPQKKEQKINVPPPNDRQVGNWYTTPNGRYLWTGEGWQSEEDSM